MERPKIIVENIKSQDIDEIIKIGLATPELHIQNEEPAYYSKEMLEGFIRSPHDIYLVAKVDGEVAGYRLASYNPYLKEAYLIDMVVIEKFRGQGIASALYKQTFEMLNEKGCFWAWSLVKEGNEKIAQILIKKGFHKGEKFSVYYKVAPF